MIQSFSLDDVLVEGIDSRGQSVNFSHGERLSCYFTSNSFKNTSNIIDLSSSTASQATLLEKSDFKDLVKRYPFKKDVSVLFEIENEIINRCKCLYPSHYDFLTLTSGSDCDAVLALMMSEYGQSYVRITIGLEESGRASQQLQDLNIDLANVPFPDSLSAKSLFSEKDRHNKYLKHSYNLPLRDDTGQVSTVEKIEQKISEILSFHSQSKDKPIFLIRHMNCSKTGLSAPSESFLRRLKKRYVNQIIFVSDNCQYRSWDQSYNETGLFDAVFVSFSKFFQSPVFSSILLVSRKSPLYDKLNKAKISNYQSLSCWSPSMSSRKIISEIKPRYCSLLRILHGIERVSFFLQNDGVVQFKLCCDLLSSTINNYYSTVGESTPFIAKIPNPTSGIALVHLRPEYSCFMGPRFLYGTLCTNVRYQKTLLIGQPVSLSSNVNSFINYNIRLSVGFRHLLAPEKLKTDLNFALKKISHLGGDLCRKN